MGIFFGYGNGFSRNGIHHVTGDIPGGDVRGAEQYCCGGGKVDAVACVRLLQKPEGKVFFLLRHFWGRKAVGGALCHQGGNDIRLFRVGGIAPVTVVQKYRCGLFCGFRQGKVGLQSLGKLVAGGQIGRLTPVFRQGSLGNGVFRGPVRIFCKTAGKQGFVCGIIGKITQLGSTPGADGDGLTGYV